MVGRVFEAIGTNQNLLLRHPGRAQREPGPPNGFETSKNTYLLRKFNNKTTANAWPEIYPLHMPASYVYIMTNRHRTTLYTGITSDLVKRVQQHQVGDADGFTKFYQVHMLVYFEVHTDITIAIQREKRIKRWRRQWKVELIESKNPGWVDLYPRII